MAGKKETALDLSKFIDKPVRVKLSGGREGAASEPLRLPSVLNQTRVPSFSAFGSIRTFRQTVALLEVVEVSPLQHLLSKRRLSRKLSATYACPL